MVQKKAFKSPATPFKGLLFCPPIVAYTFARTRSFVAFWPFVAADCYSRRESRNYTLPDTRRNRLDYLHEHARRRGVAWRETKRRTIFSPAFLSKLDAAGRVSRKCFSIENLFSAGEHVAGRKITLSHVLDRMRRTYRTFQSRESRTHFIIRVAIIVNRNIGLHHSVIRHLGTFSLGTAPRRDQAPYRVAVPVPVNSVEYTDVSWWHLREQAIKTEIIPKYMATTNTDEYPRGQRYGRTHLSS